MVCSICYERFTAPVALPCGHIFCHECIRRTVDASQMSPLQHSCPTCRAKYNIVAVESALVPPYIRPYILPALRPVFFDDAALESGATASDGTTPEAAPSKPMDHDFEGLRLSCATWRRRAEVHAAANSGLLGFARAAKEYTLCMRAERDQALNRCAVLERRLADLLKTRMTASPLDSEWDHAWNAELAPRMQPEAPTPLSNLPTSQSVQRPNSSLEIHPMLAHFLAGP